MLFLYLPLILFDGVLASMEDTTSLWTRQKPVAKPEESTIIEFGSRGHKRLRTLS